MVRSSRCTWTHRPWRSPRRLSSVTEELLKRSELLADWTVEKSEVDEADDGEEDYEVGVAPEDAKVAAGALVHSTVVMVDELFQDLHVLMREETNVAEAEHPVWLLDELPSRYALRYDAKSARRFLATVLAMTTRFTYGSFQQLGCLAEELGLKLLLDQSPPRWKPSASSAPEPRQALDCFADEISEDTDFEWLCDDSKDGIEEDEALDRFGTTPLGFASWCRPFNQGRYVPPFSSDERRRKSSRLSRWRVGRGSRGLRAGEACRGAGSEGPCRCRPVRADAPSGGRSER